MNARTICLIAGMLLAVGCEPKYASTLPQKDPDLRKTRIQFAADAAKRSYPADAQKTTTYDLRAQVGYSLNVVEIANLTNQDWDNCEVWLNHKYVIFVPHFRAHQLVRLWFNGIYDNSGNPFPSDNSKTMVNSVEIYKDGVLYNLPVHLAD